jgi:hypothetical protein
MSEATDEPPQQDTESSSHPIDLVGERRRLLRSVVDRTFEDARLHSRGFAIRLLGRQAPYAGAIPRQFEPDAVARDISYSGIPALAYLGFAIGAGRADEQVCNLFVSRVEAVVDKEGSRLNTLIDDDVALLGVADGLSSLEARPAASVSGLLRAALLSTNQSRTHALALELLDPRGRLSVEVEVSDFDAACTDLALRYCWPEVYRTVAAFPVEDRQSILAHIIADPAPESGDLDRAAIWLVAFSSLVSEAAREATVTTSDVVQQLRHTQGSLKRWVWDESSRRQNADPARWLLDNEYHAQAFLYAVLYPIFRAEVLEEQYLRGFGFTQPRYDLAIEDLSLIIEVKFARQRRDFNKFEEEIAGDLGLYFGPQSPFKSLIVYVYDDCDRQHPELYDSFRDALRKRDRRIEDVVIIRRPSMIPDRSNRKASHP